MLLVSEYDPCLDVDGKLPPSLIRKIYLTQGLRFSFKTKASLFGKPLFFVYLGYQLKVVEQFIQSAPKDADIILISPLSKWNLYQFKFSSVEGIERSDYFDTRESKVALVKQLTGLSKDRSSEALEAINYNFSLLERNLDLLRWCAMTGSSVTEALASVEYYSYNDVLFYLSGSPKHSRDRFLKTLAKYRYANKHMLKYLRSVIDNFVDVTLLGEKPSKEHSYVVKKLGEFLYLEDALCLQILFKRANSLVDLLRGELGAAE